ncbi:MAG: ABC transporter permease [Acidobacteriia bacterium]|nr:ABC transporter permease [Terriglobia bacterium]
MNVVESASVAYESLLANKLRAGLTMLGMTIGTASIILVVTIALTSKEYILQQIQGVGSNLIYLYYEAGNTVSGTKSRADDLTLGDLNAVQLLPGVADATGIVVKYDRLSLRGREREITVIGTTPDYLRVRNLRILAGRFFDDSDERSFNKVCLLTEDLAVRLFGTLDVRGKSIRLFHVRFETIGVFREGVETFGTSEVSTYSALIPIPIMQQFDNNDKLDQIYASARRTESVPSVTRRIQQLVESRHRAGTSYRVENLAEILRAAGRIATAITIVLFLIGTISLVISGIGIMNIMLVSVTERTKEIGVRMAVGARRREILYQFLAESTYMASIGGGLGILLGVSGPLLANWFTGFNIPISWISIVLAFLLSFTVGITSGLIPANRAAKLDPTEALRYE